jgi:hypothetical protein
VHVMKTVLLLFTIFRRISSKVYRYTSPIVQEKDATWRKKCYLCQFIDPTTYGVLPEYAFGPPADTEPIKLLPPLSLGPPNSVEQEAPESVTPCHESKSDDSVCPTDGNPGGTGQFDDVADAAEVQDTFPVTPYTILAPLTIGIEEGGRFTDRSVSVAEVREQLRSASTDQFRAIFSQMQFPKRTSSSSDGVVYTEEANLTLSAVGDRGDTGFEKLLDAPTFEPGEQTPAVQASTSDFISKYNKKSDDLADVPTHNEGLSRSSSSAAVANTPSPRLSKFRTSTAAANTRTVSVPSSSGPLASLMKDSVPFATAHDSKNSDTETDAFSDSDHSPAPPPSHAVVVPLEAVIAGLNPDSMSPGPSGNPYSILTPDEVNSSEVSPLTSPKSDIGSVSSNFGDSASGRSSRIRPRAAENLFLSQYAPESGRASLITGGFSVEDIRSHQQSYSEDFRDSVQVTKPPTALPKVSSTSDISGDDAYSPVPGPFSSMTFRRHGVHRSTCDGDTSICSLCKEIGLSGRLLSNVGQSYLNASSYSPPGSGTVNYGRAYARSTKLMGFVSASVTPRVRPKYFLICSITFQLA